MIIVVGILINIVTVGSLKIVAALLDALVDGCQDCTFVGVSVVILGFVVRLVFWKRFRSTVRVASILGREWLRQIFILIFYVTCNTRVANHYKSKVCGYSTGLTPLDCRLLRDVKEGVARNVDWTLLLKDDDPSSTR